MFSIVSSLSLCLTKLVVFSLRMYPGAGMVERVAARDDVIPLRFPVRSPDGSYINAIPVKAGQKVLVSNPAVDRLQLACDDNHADAADEAKALENFRSFSDSYLSTQLKFLGDAKLGE